MDHPRRGGIFHKTTMEMANQKAGRSDNSTTMSGFKRPQEEVAVRESSRNATPDRWSQQQQSHRPRKRPRLSPGSIEELAVPESDYTQREEISATPGPSLDPRLSLSHPCYDLPAHLVRNLQGLGIRSIYPWQMTCLLGPGLLSGEKNLVYSAPTGGGKSLVADVLMLKRVLEGIDCKALLVLPYVALVQEKTRYLRNVVQGLRRPVKCSQDNDKRRWMRRADHDTVRVVGFFGGSRVKSTWADFDIGVCTIEKANTLVNQAIEEGDIGPLRCIVVDELHMVDDDQRGYILEVLAAKLLSINQTAQIIGMSATLKNHDVLASWLEGHSYETNYKPIPIQEYLVYDSYAYPVRDASLLVKTASQVTSSSVSTQAGSTPPTRMIQPSGDADLKDPIRNAVVSLAIETVTAGYGVLVFAGSRSLCESLAHVISQAMPDTEELGSDIRFQRQELLSDLRSLSTGIDPMLKKTVPYGVVFHHAGLTLEEREHVAEAYDKGVVKVCVATCSLAAGINLPARRVILHSARMGRDIVGPAMLRQMLGRAGRKGKDEIGETYLCCRKGDLEEIVDLLNADLPEVTSRLNTDKRRMKRALLEVIAIRLATTMTSIRDYVKHSLFQFSNTDEETEMCVVSSLERLYELGFVIIHEDEYQVTRLGKAVVASSIDPDDGLFIYNELKSTLKAFVMDGEMHLLYTLTPVQYTDVNVNWKTFLNELQSLDESGHRVVQLLGLKVARVTRIAQGELLRETTTEEKDLARRYRRFYLALQLRDLCNEMPVHVVARKYEMARGTVQSLGQTSQLFAAGMIKFCNIMDWGLLAAALDHFVDRLKAGARTELLGLSKITFIKSRTARVFWEAGFRSVAVVANAKTEELVPVLMQAQPNEIRLKGQQEDRLYEAKLLAKAQMIVDSANRIWQLEMQAEVDEE